MMDTPGTNQRAARLSDQLRRRHFQQVALGLRARTADILKRWRSETLIAMPDLDRLTIVEFEDSMAVILETVAATMESNDPADLHTMLEHAPLHGLERFVQNFTLDALLTEERTLRAAIIIELREHMQRDLDEDEAAALHELIGLVIEGAVVALIRKRGEHQDEQVQRQFLFTRRLADLGMLVAGVAHDAANLLLPLRAAVDRLQHDNLSAEAKANVQMIEHIFDHFKNTITNLRWLSVNPTHQHAHNEAVDVHRFAQKYQTFQRAMLPGAIAFEFNVPAGLPEAAISDAALSQALLNLIRNAEQAILSANDRGTITLRARAGPDDTVILTVEDDGPGMSEEVRRRCMEPFFTTGKKDSSSTGLGLSLVHALIVERARGRIDIASPPPGKDRGTAFVLTLPVHHPPSPA